MLLFYRLECIILIITNNIFQNCPKLIEINSRNRRNPLIKEYEGSTAAFDEIVYHNAKLFVPEESVQLYMVANDWEKFD